MNDQDRFFQKVEVTNECWLWKGAKNSQGYGFFWFRKKNAKAHRAAFIMFNKEIPDDMIVCHVCDNPSCVNPKHLFLGTHLDNTNDSINKGRFRPKPYKNRILTADQVKDILRKYKNNDFNMNACARMLGVSPGTINDIVKGRTYKEIKAW